MTTHFKVILFMACLLVFTSSCKKNSVTPISPPTSILENVYLVGFENNGKGPIQAKLWNNGKDISLSNPTLPAQASSVFVSGTNVYATGSLSNNVGYWKNGVFKVLASAPDNVSGGESIFVSNNDVYVAGYETNYANNFFTQTIAKIWKNDKAITLGDSMSNSAARSVFVTGSDVYVAGSRDRKATIWINGTVTNLTDGTNMAFASSVVKSGSNVYVVGQEFVGKPNQQTGETNSIIKLWKNGMETNITDGSTQAYVHSVIVSGSDVYIAGEETSSTNRIFQAKLWKNGVPTNLSDGKQQATALGIYVNGTDVYVAGSDSYAAKVWKNGVVFDIPSNASSFSSIFIKQ
jgi:hypothetical protein